MSEQHMNESSLRNFTINFGPQHPEAHGVLRRALGSFCRQQRRALL